MARDLIEILNEANQPVPEDLFAFAATLKGPGKGFRGKGKGKGKGFGKGGWGRKY